MASSRLTAQDYIPKKLVGYTYGSEPWQLHRPPNPLSERQAYVRTGSNGVFEVRPAVLNFAGFHLGNAYTQHVSIVNISGRSQRLHLLQPTTSAFRLSYNKKGAIAPGMSEQLSVRFEPTEYRYYADCVRIHALGENLLLPLHAFPVLNAAQHTFPSLVDMGAVAVGQRASKRVQMVCDVPVQFEYRLSVLNQNPDFCVFPLQGVVPANGRSVGERAADCGGGAGVRGWFAALGWRWSRWGCALHSPFLLCCSCACACPTDVFFFFSARG